MLDGFIARRFDWCTEFGAKLDSVSDLILYFSVGVFLWLNANPDVVACFPYMAIGVTLQLIHWMYALWRFGQYPSYHSTLSRVCAYMIFFGVLAFWAGGVRATLPSIFLLWSVCSCEGLVISAMLRSARTNVSSVFVLLDSQ
jgi:CDP-diacylglycerol--glycerol-3-phosphate 3-phosphatidyltransferase